MRLSKNFKLAELTRSATADRLGVANTLNENEVKNLEMLAERVLQPIRDLFGVPVSITSGFRNEQVNRAVGGVETSQHRSGQAADFRVSGLNAREAFNRIIASGTIPFDQIILYDDGRNNFVHASFNPQRAKQRGEILFSRNTPRQ